MVLKNTRSPGLQLVFVDALGGGGLLLGTAGQQEADALLIDGAYKTAAVKTGLSGVATTLVGHAQETHGVDDQFGSLVADALANLIDLGHQALFGQKFVHVVGRVVRRRMRIDCQPGGRGNDERRGNFSHGA